MMTAKREWGRLRYFLISIKSVFDYHQSLALRNSGDVVVRRDCDLEIERAPFAKKIKNCKMSENIRQKHAHESSKLFRTSKVMGRVAFVAAAAALIAFYFVLFYISPQR